MESSQHESLRARVAQTLNTEGAPLTAAVPIDELSVFLTLCGEVCAGLAGAGAALRFVVDANTASQLRALDPLAAGAGGATVIGDAPDRWATLPNVSSAPLDGRLRPGDRALVAMSDRAALALVGSPDGAEGFDGVWTADPATVSRIGAALLGAAFRAAAPGQSGPDSGSAALAYQLMSAQASALASRNRAYAMDKHDLISVLEILKAISAKRRAHDILFVFVEQIARVVEMNRCSIVRIWGSGRYGQVLASHEDANVQDRSIDLEKYPELHKAMATRKKVIIHDVANDPLTAAFAPALAKANIGALAVVPIVLFDEHVGTLLLRAARSRPPFTLRELSFFEIVAEAASNALERAHLFESIQVANRRLEHLATTDGLTGLYNHRHFRERLDGELQRALRYRLPLSCLIFDVDDFKSLNDSYGHLLGDSVLRELAQLAQEHIRKSDLIARYGGEEFVVIMPQTDLDGAMSEAERLREQIAGHHYQGVPPDRRVTVSLGVASLDFDGMASGDDLLHAADKALYEAKNSGKNRVVAAGPRSDA